MSRSSFLLSQVLRNYDLRPISQDSFIEEPKPTDDPQIYGSALQTSHSVHSETVQVGSAADAV